ncbi:hypothetical protein ACWPKO_13220 [Coraliomargarita sp. W4R53]
MKIHNYIIPFALFGGFLFNSSLSAQEAIIDNNFDTVDVLTYRGSDGAAFTVGGSSENTLLGNATAKSNFGTVRPNSGVGNSRRFGNFDPNVRSRSTTSISTGATFDFYFEFAEGTVEVSNQGFIGAGFALAAGTDDSQVYNADASDRFFVGLAQRGVEDDLSQVEFAGFGRLVEATSFVDSPEITLTEGNWYNLSFELSYSGSNEWVIDDLKLIGYTGASFGTIASGESWSMSTITGYNPAFGNNLDSATEAYAMITGNKGRGLNSLDNILVTSIPEPSAYALLLSFTCLVVVAAGRERR